MSEPSILIVEDEKPIVHYMKTMLSTQHYKTEAAYTGQDGLSLTAAMSPDLVLLDLGLPDMDGVAFISSLRSWSRVPIIIVSARGQERDQIEALDAGADDYLVKPFKAGTLLARIRALLRRVSQPGQDVSPLDVERFEYGPLTMDIGKRRVYVQGNEVHLTPIEYKILLVFLRHPGKVLTHSFLQGQVWGQINPDQYGNIRVFVSGLRRKIQVPGDDLPLIETEIGVGYRLAEFE